ncbi:5'-nucleotidase C-terminal domain-containing protein [Macrococcoides caseolyticum]|uniref:5'-nucleotidase C-terminal domain-containing protein n=1 Tax=Macrococcoides caseolyticum TaxID=69966 RepID=UPI001F249DC0|nr:5'-nucleotidase C-terminal domain-containing protein [Macrococcus caseolyticus]MCE4957486.1 5'-nucleotidase C-terminal domain-containing protein [Macrococcus caseolyticus]
MYKLSILATTDTHSHISLYDYFLENESKVNGLILAGSKIETIKAENEKQDIATVVVDNGDILQGNIMADYAAEMRPDIHPAINMMNEIGYDAGTLGNHEFNYGLDYLKEANSKAQFEMVNCNVKYINGDYVVSPYHILQKVYKDGTKVTIGITGVVPEQIMMWDEAHLSERVIVEDMYDALFQTSHQLKAQGCDIVIALMHTGLDQEQLEDMRGIENQVYQLTQIDAIDAFVFGHTHQQFPGSDYEGIPQVDAQIGKIFNAYGVQPMCFASHLGRIDLELEKTESGLNVVQGKSQVIELKSSDVVINSHLVSVNEAAHNGVLNYIKRPIGSTTRHHESYFAQVGTSSVVEVIARAGKKAIEEMVLCGQLKIASEHIISTSAPIKAGRDGVNDYIDINPGELTLKDALNIYRFPNKLSVVNVNGKVLREWIEWNVSCFNTMGSPYILKDNKSTAPGFPSYNMDIFYELKYCIDLSREARYSNVGEKINDTYRITSLTYRRQPVTDDMQFTVLTTDYRTNFCPILNDSSVIKLQIDDIEIRQVIMSYIKEKGMDFEPTRPFTFKQEGRYLFKSSPAGINYLQSGITPTDRYDEDYLVYEFDTSII